MKPFKDIFNSKSSIIEVTVDAPRTVKQIRAAGRAKAARLKASQGVQSPIKQTPIKPTPIKPTKRVDPMGAAGKTATRSERYQAAIDRKRAAGKNISQAQLNIAARLKSGEPSVVQKARQQDPTGYAAKYGKASIRPLRDPKKDPVAPGGAGKPGTTGYFPTSYDTKSEYERLTRPMPKIKLKTPDLSNYDPNKDPNTASYKHAQIAKEKAGIRRNKDLARKRKNIDSNFAFGMKHGAAGDARAKADAAFQAKSDAFKKKYPNSGKENTLGDIAARQKETAEKRKADRAAKKAAADRKKPISPLSQSSRISRSKQASPEAQAMMGSPGENPKATPEYRKKSAMRPGIGARTPFLKAPDPAVPSDDARSRSNAQRDKLKAEMEATRKRKKDHTKSLRDKQLARDARWKSGEFLKTKEPTPEKRQVVPAFVEKQRAERMARVTAQARRDAPLSSRLGSGRRRGRGNQPVDPNKKPVPFDQAAYDAKMEQEKKESARRFKESIDEAIQLAAIGPAIATAARAGMTAAQVAARFGITVAQATARMAATGARAAGKAAGSAGRAAGRGAKSVGKTAAKAGKKRAKKMAQDKAVEKVGDKIRKKKVELEERPEREGDAAEEVGSKVRGASKKLADLTENP